MHFSRILAAAAAAAICPALLAAEIDTAPVDVSANDDARALYRLLLDNYGKRVITGSVAEDARDFQNAEYIRNITGHYPVINCQDYIQHNQAWPVNPSGWSSKNYSDPGIDADWARNGGIVSYQWHWRTPSYESNINNFDNSNYGFYCNGTGGQWEKDSNFSLSNAMNNAGSWERRVIDRDLEAIGGYLKNMQDAGVAVLWRPLHEAAGNYDKGWGAWFWWGNSGPEPMKWLWKYMFDKFAGMGIHNLLWVWTSTGNIDRNWYPGDDYVDIIGLDYYEENSGSYRNSLSRYYNDLKSISGRKMLALSECGAIPSIENMRNGGDMWSYAIPWSGHFTRDNSHNPESFFREFYSSPLVAHRDNIGTAVDPDPEQPENPVYGEEVLWANESSPALIDWSNIIIRISAEKCRSIRQGDQIAVTVTKINDSGWPKYWICPEGTDRTIFEQDTYPDRGQQMPRTYTHTVSSPQLADMSSGMYIKGENCYVSKVTLQSKSGTGTGVETWTDETEIRSDLYTLQGIAVRRDVTLKEALEGLPAGIYIFNNKKILVK